MPEKGITLDGGSEVKPSRLQRKLWAWWCEFWDWIPDATHGETWDLVVNGDAIDGVHHGSNTQVTHNLAVQCRIAQDCLLPITGEWEGGRCKKRGRLPGRFWMIRGTEAHTGQSAQEEEKIAEKLGAQRCKDGNFSRYELWKQMGKHLVHFNHHIGTTGSSHHESSAVNAEVSGMLVEAARWNETPASVIVRSHRHRSIEVRLPRGRMGFITAVTTPAWQLKTPFAYKVAGARQSPPQVGGVVVRLDSRGDTIYTNTWVRHVERDSPE